MQKVTTFRPRGGAVVDAYDGESTVTPIPAGTAIIHVHVSGDPIRVCASEFSAEPDSWGIVTQDTPAEIRITLGREKFLHIGR